MANGVKQLIAAFLTGALFAVASCAQRVNGSIPRSIPVEGEGGGVRTVYVSQVYYHTGIVIELNNPAVGLLDFGPLFKGFRYADIGWGEEFFYQNPEFSLSKAARALLWQNRSVVRVEGFNQNIDDVLAWSDRAMKITVTKEEFIRLCEFINGSLIKNKDTALVIASSHGGGSVIFFKSPYSYDLFDTCNTWVARAFNYAGLDISPCGVVTAGALFCRLNKVGVFVKSK